MSSEGSNPHSWRTGRQRHDSALCRAAAQLHTCPQDALGQAQGVAPEQKAGSLWQGERWQVCVLVGGGGALDLAKQRWRGQAQAQVPGGRPTFPR